MSKTFSNYLGYSLEELKKEFMENGFPKIYNDISDIDKIKDLYKRDL